MPVHQLGAMDFSDAALWLDVEYAAYKHDLPHWFELARRAHGTTVDVGAGVGRVSIPLAMAGYDVIAVDLDVDSIEVLRDRARQLGLVFDTAVQDARDLWLPRHVPLIILACSTIQHLGPRRDRSRFLERASWWLQPGGTLAVALHAETEPWDAATHGLPEPDVLERDGHLYVSQPTGLRHARERRELLCDRSVDGGTPVHHADIQWRLTPKMLASEAAHHGLTAVRARTVSDGERDDAVFVELRKGLLASPAAR